ncbi:unnamed protein product [Cladocopium goreaui]|uniref:Uncharacterized protein n=1 Tax=Cladocopium goreaui TaxID=2562237 RepID=A0A9P1CCC9_9DINO|nr:unnamed protein product [Cladocopium goreaui]
MEAFSKQAQAQAAAHMKDRSEVESLKARIRAAQEEAQEFRSVAANARQVAQTRSQERAMQEAEADQSDDDEDTMLLKQKIKAQQDQLDRLLEIFRRQQEQVVKLQDQLSGREEERQKVLKREVEAKLKDRESQVEALLRQLRCAEEESRESMELRSQLRDFAEQSINRDHVLAEMRSVFKQQAAVDGLQQERLFMVLEDLKSFSWNRPWHPVNEMEASSLRGDESPTDVNASAVHVCEAGSAAKQVQVDLDPANALPVVYRRRLLQQLEDLNIEKALLEKRAAREVQDLESLVKLQQDDLRRRREAKSDSPKPLPKKQEMTQDFVVESDWQGEDDVLPVVPVDVQSAWFAAQKVEFHDISSDGEDVLDAEQRPEEVQEYPAGLHYVQRVAELEAQSDELKQCLEALHASESALRRESQEKNDLIAVLLRKAKLPDSETGGFNAASLWLVIAEGCGEIAKLLPKRCFDLLPAASKKTFGPLHFLAKNGKLKTRRRSESLSGLWKRPQKTTSG